MIDIVWVHHRKKHKADALRWSVESVRQNITDDCSRMCIVGDYPGDWFEGKFIECRRVSKRGMKKSYNVNAASKWLKWCDSVHKLKTIIKCNRIAGRFLWLYDDSFIVRPTTVGELAEPRYGRRVNPTSKPERRTWRECKRRTFEALANAGLPTFDYSTHYPAVFEKIKLQATIEKFDAIGRPRVIESLYLNQWAVNPRPIGRRLHYTGSPTRTPPTFHRDTIIWNIGNGHYHASRDAVLRMLGQEVQVIPEWSEPLCRTHWEAIRAASIGKRALEFGVGTAETAMADSDYTLLDGDSDDADPYDVIYIDSCCDYDPALEALAATGACVFVADTDQASQLQIALRFLERGTSHETIDGDDGRQMTRVCL